jgi:endonuclease YncB( thermonuclease family)
MLLLVTIDLVQAKVVSGPATVVDGDTFIIDNIKIRLNAIDAPETDQLCLNASNEVYSCGILARDRLRARIGGGIVICHTDTTDRYGRSLANCFLGDEDLNHWLVSEGLALSYVQYSDRYKAAEDVAKRRKKGLWSGAFVAPWDWRHRTLQTVFLGATASKVNTAALSKISAQVPPSAECAIKGNVNRNGERIYFVPGNSAYGKVLMDKDLGERWFCTEAEAEAAGWRKPRN